jgi:hypothetical protein
LGIGEFTIYDLRFTIYDLRLSSGARQNRWFKTAMIEHGLGTEGKAKADQRFCFTCKPARLN